MTSAAPPAALPAAGARVVLVPMLYLAENVLGGPLGVYAGVPVRYLLFAVTVATAGLAMLWRARIARAHAAPMLVIAALLGVHAVWAVIIPVVQGTRFEFALAESRAFAVLAMPLLALGACGPVTLRAVLERLQRVAVYCCVLLACAQLAIWIVGTLTPQYHAALPLLLAAAFPEARESIFVGPMPDGFFRVFWISSIWYTVTLFWVGHVVPRPWTWVVRAILLVGVLVSYSRGIWLGVAVGYTVAYLVQLRGRDALLVSARTIVGIAAAMVVLAALAVATGQTERVTGRLSSSVSTDDASIDERVKQVPPLLALWERNPIVGGGYGAYSTDMIRSDTAPYSYEHMPLAFLAKLGIVGVAATLGFLALVAGTAWARRRAGGAQAASFLGGGSAFLIAAGTNPMIINLIGMAMTSATAACRASTGRTTVIGETPDVGGRSLVSPRGERATRTTPPLQRGRRCFVRTLVGVN